MLQYLQYNNRDIIFEVEKNITSILQNLIEHGSANFKVINDKTWKNYHLNKSGNLETNSDRKIKYRTIEYMNIRSKHNFAIIIHAFSIIHCTLLKGGHHTFRELYYCNKIFTKNQRNITKAINLVCSLLHTTPWDMKIVASAKGLVAGALRIRMTNGDVIDCQSIQGASLLPNNFGSIESLETNAKFLLIVEKDTIFQKLLNSNIFEIIGNDIILVTGRGFPDMCTRNLVNRIHKNFSIPIYVITDADPFGIEILLVYRYGSRSLAYCATHLACPAVHWLGIYPSEMNILNLMTVPFNRRDFEKIQSLLSRHYINSAERKEINILYNLQKKSSIESITTNLFVEEYIPNKIMRNYLFERVISK